MATYVNDLRLKEIGTGESSGSWGTETNTNLELIGEALGYGTEGITTNADTHTSTIADGATDPVRAMYVKYTGTLDSACTITIAPNTVNRMQFIENATSGSQNIIISQGSGANITIPAGDVKAVYLDGAGSGAAVVDAFASLNVVDLKVQDDLTVTDDLIVNGDIDLAGSIDVDGTTNLDAVDIDGATQIDATVTVGVDDTGYDVKFFGATSGAYMLWDESADDLKLVGAAGLTVAGDIDVDGTTNLDAVDIDGAVQLDSTLSVGVDGTGHDVKFFGDTASAYMLWDQSRDDLILGGAAQLGIGTTTPGHPLHISEAADGTKIQLTRGGISEWAFSIGNTSTLSGVGSGALEILPLNGGTANEFAIGTSGSTAPLFHLTNAQNYFAKKVGIGTTAPDTPLHVKGASGTQLTVDVDTGGRFSQVDFEQAGTQKAAIWADHTTDLLGIYGVAGYGINFYSDATERMRILSGGNLCIGRTNATFNDTAGISLNPGSDSAFINDGQCLSLNRTGSHGVITGYYYDSSSVGTISTNANSLPSDRNFKRDISDLDLGLNLVNKLKPSQYNYKIDSEDCPKMYGLVAQDLEQSLEEVGIEKNSTWLLQHEPNEDEKQSDYNLDYLKLTPILIKAIQEQQEQIEALQSEINILKGGD